MTITGTVFKLELETLGFACWDPRDRLLFCPSEMWLKEFAAFPATIRKPPKKEARDCDDYAMWAVTQASEACADAMDDGHTFALVRVRLWAPLNGVPLDEQGITGHATNIVKLNGGRMVFFEPQSGLYCDAKTVIDSGDVVPVCGMP